VALVDGETGAADQTVAEAAGLPGLAPRVAELFVQLSP
jgi:hypothetical protein